MFSEQGEINRENVSRDPGQEKKSPGCSGFSGSGIELFDQFQFRLVKGPVNVIVQFPGDVF